MVIKVTDRLSIDEADISEEFVRSSGAGGQNVNKVATAVQLRFSAAGVSKLPELWREKFLRIAGHRATKAGEVVIIAQRHRTQERNRADALERLTSLLREATVRQAHRVATKPTRASDRQRLEGKRRQAVIKDGRRRRDAET